MIWLPELELTSFLGKIVFGNCRSSSEVTDGLSAGIQIVTQGSEPGNKGNGPCLLPSTSFVSCQARGSVVLTGLLLQHEPLGPLLRASCFHVGLTPEAVGQSFLRPQTRPTFGSTPVRAVSLCTVFWCRF